MIYNELCVRSSVAGGGRVGQLVLGSYYQGDRTGHTGLTGNTGQTGSYWTHCTLDLGLSSCQVWDTEMGGLKTEIVGNKAFFSISYSPVNRWEGFFLLEL